ncbi:MAG TPA: sulfite exporter TauE/SafE family protein [Thermoplasmata archaeon]|nr:sulfite exporter TauE/SafE family protein [Thermoplasmata archaeon]
MDLWSSIWLAIVAFGAAVTNGAVGYGFSSIITPIAIFWYSNKVLNPALVLVEVAVNIALLLRERQHIRATWPRARPVVTTLFPGVVLGTLGLTFIAVTDVKLLVYATLLPLVALQLLGFSRPIANERRGGQAIGSGIGFLYSLTTISGPPLALFLRNQGLSKGQFRCTIAQIRVAESTLTLGTYLAFDQFLGTKYYTAPSLGLLPALFIAVIIGVPLGTLLLRSVSPDFFRSVVMSLDGILVSYGLSQVFVALKWVASQVSYYVFAALLAVVLCLSWYSLRRTSVREPGGGPPLGPGVHAPPTPPLPRSLSSSETRWHSDNPAAGDPSRVPPTGPA